MNSGLVSSHRFFWMGLLVVMNLAVFSGVSEFEFLNYDDEAYVSKNPHIRDGLTADGILWAFSAGLIFPSTNTDYWQPLTFVSRMMDIELFGLDPAMHHLTNLVFHILNTLLLFRVWFRMTGRMERSFWLAALFAIHPLHVEPVAWVTQRKDVLYAFFWLLTMRAYLGYVERPSGKRYGLVMGLFACSLMSKSMAVTLPCALLLLDYWPLNRMTEDRSRKSGFVLSPQSSVLRRLILEKIPLLALSLISGFLTVRGQFSHVHPHSPFIIMGNALVSYATYLFKMIYPAGFAVHYPHPGESLTLLQIGGAALCIILISIWVVSGARKAPWRLVGWCWFLGTLSPLMSINDIAGADRFTYLPLTGIFMMIIWQIAERMSVYVRWYGPLRCFAGIALGGLMIISRIQTGHWRDNETVTRHAIETVPGDWIAQHQMGIMLLDRGDIDRGEFHLRESIRLNPGFSYAHYNLGIAMIRKGKLREAIGCFEKSARFSPGFFDAHCNIGDAWLLLGNAVEAERHYFRAIQINPGYAPAHHHLALSLAGRGCFHQAGKHFQTALQLQPPSSPAGQRMIEDIQALSAPQKPVKSPAKKR